MIPRVVNNPRDPTSKATVHSFTLSLVCLAIATSLIFDARWMNPFSIFGTFELERALQRRARFRRLSRLGELNSRTGREESRLTRGVLHCQPAAFNLLYCHPLQIRSPCCTLGLSAAFLRKGNPKPPTCRNVVDSFERIVSSLQYFQL